MEVVDMHARQRQPGSTEGLRPTLVLVLLLALAVPGLAQVHHPGPAPEVPEGWLGPAPVAPHPEAIPTLTWQLPEQDGLSVDTGIRSAVVDFYDTYYTPNLSVTMSWTGSIAGCIAGTTSQAYIDATMEMINYYRAMSGLPGDVSNVTSLNDDCQEAALMMIAEGSLSHDPPPTWACYTVNGDNAAGSSNLALGNAGPSAIVAYIRDSGAGNTAVGHRRWILYPLQIQMATGSNDGVNGYYYGANDLYVFAGFGSRPGSPWVVAWPPPGYVPYQLVYDRWSMALNTTSASFASADVTMTLNGGDVPLTIIYRDGGYGDKTIVWEPSGLSFGSGQEDQTVHVTVTGISGASDVSYDVTVIDPLLSPDIIFEDRFESGGTSNWTDTVP
jgi:hypothetical protein